MSQPIRVPEMGESVVEATVGEWLKKEGDAVSVGDIIVELETDKVDVEVGAETSGVLTKIERQSGEDVTVGDVLGIIAPGDGDSPTNEAAPAADVSKSADNSEQAAPANEADAKNDRAVQASPVAQRMAQSAGVDVTAVSGSGPRGRVLKQDVESHLQKETAVSPSQSTPSAGSATPTANTPPLIFPAQTEKESRTKMSRRRRTIASRLVEAQQTAAMLTTFNEIDMSAVIDLRKRRQDSFVERHGIKVGFTSFFVKASVGALKAFPRLNAEIDGDDMVIKHYYDIGIAVGAEDGLVVPVLRDADRMSFATIEKEVKTFAQKSRDGNLSLADLQGGTFTITNGGVFGSMLSTPILNPPQVGILGLHNIVERPMAINGQVEIRPIMYVALTYDHRIVDGREAVQFLVRIKQMIEEPETLLLEG